MKKLLLFSSILVFSTTAYAGTSLRQIQNMGSKESKEQVHQFLMDTQNCIDTNQKIGVSKKDCEAVKKALVCYNQRLEFFKRQLKETEAEGELMIHRDADAPAPKGEAWTYKQSKRKEMTIEAAISNGKAQKGFEVSRDLTQQDIDKVAKYSVNVLKCSN